MKKLLLSICILITCHAVYAGDPAKATASASPSPAAAAKGKAKGGPVVDTKPAAGATANAVPAYAPIQKTQLVVPPDEHNPFWPIGWVKLAATADSASSVVPHTEDFTVSSILLNEPPLAVINGKEMAEGEIASLDVNGQPVVVQLMAVQDGRVILRWQGQSIIVPLHRDESLSPSDSQPAGNLSQNP